MEFFAAVDHRRSVRKYTSEPVPESVIQRALDAALLAPNSSNMQTWEFYWVKNPEKKADLIAACLNQSTARSAQELIVAVANPKKWIKNTKENARILLQNKANPEVLTYYTKLMPFLYGMQALAPLKWLIFNLSGLFKPTPRGPWSYRDRLEVCIKSCALACENFMLAMSAQGFDTCPMEGFDKNRVAKILNLKCSSNVVMVMSAGKRASDGVWGSAFALIRLIRSL